MRQAQAAAPPRCPRFAGDTLAVLQPCYLNLKGFSCPLLKGIAKLLSRSLKHPLTNCAFIYVERWFFVTGYDFPKIGSNLKHLMRVGALNVRPVLWKGFCHLDAEKGFVFANRLFGVHQVQDTPAVMKADHVHAKSGFQLVNLKAALPDSSIHYSVALLNLG